MVTTCGATLAWSAMTVTVAGSVDGRLGDRRGCVLSGAVALAAGVWPTVAAGATVCARVAMVEVITAAAAINNLKPL